MPKTYTCPFWMWERSVAMGCEGCRMSFPDSEAKREFVRRYCASLEGWRRCSIARNLLEYYERTEKTT